MSAPATPLSENDLKQIIALYKEGFGSCDLAIRFHVSQMTMRRRLVAGGVVLRKRGRSTAIQRAKFSGSKHGMWKGGRFLDHGYWKLLDRSHPNHDAGGYVAEHRVVMERHLQKHDPRHASLDPSGFLKKDWVVHHKNGNKSDNEIQNLEVLPRSKHHSWMHYKHESVAMKKEILRLQTLLSENRISY